MKNSHSSTSDSLEYTKSCTKKRHAPFLSMRMDLNTIKNLPEFKSMTENSEDKLHQKECKQWKGAKICASIRRELDCKKCSKTFWQIFARQNMQNQTNSKHSINSEDIFKSTKNVLEKRSTKEDSTNTTTSKVLSKICNRKNLHSNNTTFPWLKVL